MEVPQFHFHTKDTFVTVCPKIYCVQHCILKDVILLSLPILPKELGFVKDMLNLLFICFLILHLRMVKKLLSLAWEKLGPLHQLRWNSYSQGSTAGKVLVLPLRSIDDLRQRQYHLSPVSGFHWSYPIPLCIDW